MAAHGDQVDPRIAQTVDLLAEALGRVHVPVGAVAVQYLSQFDQGLDHAGFVVDVHGGHEKGIRPERRTQPVRVQAPRCPHGEELHLESAARQLLQRFEH